MSAGYLQQLFTRNLLVNIAVCLVNEFNPYQGQEKKKPLPFSRQQNFSLVKIESI